MEEKNSRLLVAGGGSRPDGGGNSRVFANNTAKSAPSQILFTSGGRVAGEIRGDVLHKRVYGSKHQLRRPPGWAVDVAILQEAERMGARVVQVWDIETDMLYTATVADFWQKGQAIDRGFGRQVALALDHFDTYKRGQPRPTQLTLF
ncbi:MAG: hypothetical protein HY326_08085 [Chloroflexi bacterium]|nr:hypothetical protein [Chloroflexota bacterium]